MKILVTGAAGGIGSSLCQLMATSHELVMVDNLRNGHAENLTKELADRLHRIDINSQEFEELYEREMPEVLIHLAAVTSLPDCEANISDCFRVNVEGTARVLDCARRHGVHKIIFASTSAIYENSTNKDGFVESEPTEPTLFYSLSKKMSEDICRSYRQNYGLDIVVFRFFNVFGPNQDLTRKNPPLVNYVTREFANGRKPVLHSDGTQARDYVHIDDVLRAVEQALNTEFNDEYTFNICSGSTINVNEIVEAVRLASDEFHNTETVRREPHLLWDTYPQLFTGTNPLSNERVAKETNKFSLGSTDRFERRFGWTPSKETAKNVTATAKEILTKISK